MLGSNGRQTRTVPVDLGGRLDVVVAGAGQEEALRELRRRALENRDRRVALDGDRAEGDRRVAEGHRDLHRDVRALRRVRVGLVDRPLPRVGLARLLDEEEGVPARDLERVVADLEPVVGDGRRAGDRIGAVERAPEDDAGLIRRERERRARLLRVRERLARRAGVDRGHGRADDLPREGHGRRVDVLARVDRADEQRVVAGLEAGELHRVVGHRAGAAFEDRRADRIQRALEGRADLVAREGEDRGQGDRDAGRRSLVDRRSPARSGRRSSTPTWSGRPRRGDPA